MTSTKTKKIYSVLSTGIILGALVLAPFGSFSTAHAATTAKVTIMKYVNGTMATAQSANNADFTMSATWAAANLGAGTGQYALTENGFGGDTTPYQAVTADMDVGSDYSTSEVMDSMTGVACSTNETYKLMGYTYGDTLSEAQNGTPSMTAPTFTNMQSNKYVIVWNDTCAETMLKVHIMGYLDGVEATASAANNYLFPMTATWQADNVSGGTQSTGNYTLGDGSDQNHPYQTSTVDFQAPADYSTAAITNNTDSNSNILANGTACEQGKYSLVGYKTSSISFADANQNGTLSVTAPSFNDLNADAYVITYINKCGPDSGTIGGSVSGGIVPGALAVNSVTVEDSTATADGTFANGWKYTFHVTIPDSETHFSMKFGNWTNTSGSSATINAANNIRFSSQQADNSGATVMITNANTYPNPALNITTDLDPNMDGIQADIVVEVAIPSNSVNGSYTTTYGIQSL